LQKVFDEGVQGFPLIHGIAYKALVEFGIKAKRLKEPLNGFSGCLPVSLQNSR
jgi:hypothetical protein